MVFFVFIIVICFEFCCFFYICGLLLFVKNKRMSLVFEYYVNGKEFNDLICKVLSLVGIIFVRISICEFFS